MSKQVEQRLLDLEREVKYAQERAVAATDTVVSLKYETVPFVISRHFVSANLAPLQFFHLVEHIGKDGAAAAILNLYDRLAPLLTCKHQWTDLKRTTDAHAEAMVTDRRYARAKPKICQICTAYTLVCAGALPPVIGRTY